MTDRTLARQLANEHVEAGRPLDWFEALYTRADGDASVIPWADLGPSRNLVEWLDRKAQPGQGRRALVVGCGLGDDAEELARRGYRVTAFDISETAIAWCRKRFPESSVSYVTCDLFRVPSEWLGRFDLVVEIYTLQVLPAALRSEAMRVLAGLVAPGGSLVAILRGRVASDPLGEMPWPLLKEELTAFEKAGLREVSFEDYMENETPPVRRFRVEYTRPEHSADGMSPQGANLE